MYQNNKSRSGSGIGYIENLNNFNNRNNAVAIKKAAIYNKNPTGKNTNGGNYQIVRSTSKNHGIEHVEYDEEEHVSNMFNKTSILLNLIKMSLIGLGLVLFVVGILYLSIYRYPYSFTVFSIDMMAGIFVAVGVCLVFIAIISLFVIRPDRNQSSCLFYAILMILFFILLFIIGVVGLSMNANGEFAVQTRQNMISIARRYDDRLPNSHVNRKIDWLQNRFMCCGVDSYGDWRSLLRFFTNYDREYENGPVRYINNLDLQQKYPYIDDVPDSCCINIGYNCGKSVNVFGKDRGTIINTRGCFQIYSEKFSQDLTFVCSLSITISLLILIIAVLLLIGYNMINRNRLYLKRFARNYVLDQEDRNNDSLLRN
jgi:hypothetical protein